MSEVAHRGNTIFPFLPELREFFDPFPALIGWGTGSPAPQPIRVEAHFDADAYVLRAELPGIDPERDVEVSVGGGVLTLHAERTEEKTEKHHTEFRYGSFSRTLRLPADAKAEKVTAVYDAGILTVRVPLDKPAKPATRKIEVASTRSAAK